MTLSPFFIIILLIISILLIILLSTRYKFNTFFVLLFVAILVGICAGSTPEGVIQTIKMGFGHTLEKIGLLIILGTTLGLILDRTHATYSLANFILTRIGERYAPVAMVTVGFLIGLPIFCDSGFVVLSGLMLSLANRMPSRHLLLTMCLATSLYSVHCLVPPHPGISAAAGILSLDLGKAMLLGIGISIFPTIVAYFWANYWSKKYQNTETRTEISDNLSVVHDNLPSPVSAFLPIIIPILLISVKSILSIKSNIIPEGILQIAKFLGEPIVALIVGIVISLRLFSKIEKSVVNHILEEAIEKAGPILAIIAAGGAFGEIIKTLDLGKVFGETLSASNLGLLIPFLLTVIFKTAQGSSTVAILSATSILQPLLPSLGLESEWHNLLALMAMGAGSMTLSHANDAYFWVITRFGKLPTDIALRVYTTASFVMALVAFACIWLLSFL